MISNNTRVIGLDVVIKQFENLIYQATSMRNILTQIDQGLNVDGPNVILVTLLRRVYYITKLVIIVMRDITAIGLVVYHLIIEMVVY